MGWPLPSEAEIAKACEGRPLRRVNPEPGLVVYTYDILAPRVINFGRSPTNRLPIQVCGEVTVNVRSRGEVLTWTLTADLQSQRWRYGAWVGGPGGIILRQKQPGVGCSFQLSLWNVQIVSCGCSHDGETQGGRHEEAAQS